MSVNGTYKIELTTTVGTQLIELTLMADGDSLSGTMDGYFGQQSFSGGIVKGNDVSWSVDLESPVGEMKLDVKGTVSGDEITGQVQIGSFRPSEFKGTRC